MRFFNLFHRVLARQHFTTHDAFLAHRRDKEYNVRGPIFTQFQNDVKDLIHSDPRLRAWLNFKKHSWFILDVVATPHDRENNQVVLHIAIYPMDSICRVGLMQVDQKKYKQHHKGGRLRFEVRQDSVQIMGRRESTQFIYHLQPALVYHRAYRLP